MLDMVTETGLNLVLLVEELSTCSRKYVLLALASLIHFALALPPLSLPLTARLPLPLTPAPFPAPPSRFGPLP